MKQIDFSDLDEARECARQNPHRALDLINRHIAANPSDSHGYFSRHLAWAGFGKYDEALADCSKAIQMLSKPSRYMARAEIYRALGDHVQALADLNHVHGTDYETWLTSFGPHSRADTLARLGQLDAALADAELIRDDHWMPEHGGLPGGNKAQFIAEIKRRAAAAGRSPARANS